MPRRHNFGLSTENSDRMEPSSITFAGRGGALSGAVILVVEDDAIQALDISTSLEEQGAQIVGPAATLEDAFQLFEDNACDAVILDLRVGNRNATSFADKLVESGTPFVIQTGYPDSVFSKLDWAGCRRFTKPVAITDLTEALTELVQWRIARGTVSGPKATDA